MDYSDRVNSKKGAGGVADIAHQNVHTKARVRDLLSSQILDLDNDPYVFKNHLGLLECKLCLTNHVSEASYISHVGGRKHQLNLERRRRLDEKNRGTAAPHHAVSINSVPKRTWAKIGRPHYKVVKIRHPATYQTGVLVSVKYPKATVDEPLFRFLSFFELNQKNQAAAVAYHQHATPHEQFQYLVVSAEPYENIGIAIPNREIDKPRDGLSDSYWWYWDRDVGEFYLQILFK